MVNTIKKIKEIFESNGHTDYLGENVTQLQHALQCYDLAVSNKADIEMQIAAFLHDIGHFLEKPERIESENLGNFHHDIIATEWLRNNGFSQKIITVVGNHVKAKRYLCYVNKQYFDALTVASKKTLGFQGGVMSESEASDFEKEPFFEESVLLRKWDDMGKIEDAELTALEVPLNTIRKYFTTILVNLAGY